MSETFNLGLDPAVINKFMADKILQSTLGEEVEKQIAKHVSTMSYGYQSGIKTILEAETNRIIRECLTNTYAERIKELILKSVTDEVLTKLVDQMISNLKLDTRY